jgi:hypothetical protein
MLSSAAKILVLDTSYGFIDAANTLSSLYYCGPFIPFSIA